jgi:hypothetical protein
MSIKNQNDTSLLVKDIQSILTIKGYNMSNPYITNYIMFIKSYISILKTNTLDTIECIECDCKENRYNLTYLHFKSNINKRFY